MKIACGHVVRPHGLSVNRLARGVLSATETSSLSPCGQPATSRKKLTSKQFPGEPAGEEGDFLSWTLCTAIQNRQSQQVLEIWGKRAREMWQGGAGWGLQMGRKHFQGICLACHSMDSPWKSQTVVITGYWNLDSRIQVVLSFASGLPLQGSLTAIATLVWVWFLGSCINLPISRMKDTT